MKISVIMTTYNRPLHFRAALEALALQRDPDLEVVVADDGSNAESLQDIEQIANETPLPCRLIRRKRNGFRLAAARNDAVRKSRGDYLLFIDCDIALLPGTLATHRQWADQNTFLAGHRGLAGQPETEALFKTGGMTAAGLEQAWLSADKSEQDKAAARFRTNSILRRLSLVKRHKPKLIGCHFSLFRTAFDRINGFDENYVGWGLEDDDLAMRLYLAGFRSRSIMKQARALHLWHPSLQPDSSRGFSSPNLNYFNRPGITTRCINGLIQDVPPS
jgi:glycosyltransferase involved in cell wall biosynthesis